MRMATDEKTVTHLQHLERLYRLGYRSEVIDRSVDKLIALEQATARHELKDLDTSLQTFEVQYQMTARTFYERFRAGELGDTADFVEWSILYEMRESVRERLEVLEVKSA